jgi:tetratricopeptide (TPR) repeat protein
MNHSQFLTAILFLSLFLFGCNATPEKTGTASQQSKETILMDSLLKLDSLVLQYRAKNAEESMKYAREAGKLAREIDTPAAWVKTYNMMGNACSGIRIDSGFYFYNKALMVIDSFNLADKKGLVLFNLGMLNRSAGNYRNSILLIDSALRFSVTVNDFATLSNSLNSLGIFYLNIGDKLNARKMFDSAFAVANRNSLYLEMGSALGNLSRFEPDPQKSVMMQRNAIAYMEKGVGFEEPIALGLINVGYRASETDSAIFYFTRAINMVSADFAPEVIIGANNNLAYCYLSKGDLVNAEKCIIEHALPVAVKTHNIDWQSTVYDTYADILERKGNLAGALLNRKKAADAKSAFRALVSTSLIGMRNY